MRFLLALCAASCFFLYVPASEAGEHDAMKEGSIPFKRADDTASAASLWRTVVGFGLVVAVGVGAVYFLRRYVPASVGGVAGRGGRIDVLEIRRVTPRLTLFLIKVDEETVLLTQSGDHVEQLRLGTSASTPKSPPA